MARNQPLAFGAILAGGLLVTAGLSGRPLSDVAQGKVHQLPDGANNRIAGSMATAINGSGATGTPGAVNLGKGGLVNPFAHAHANVGRVDQGLDVSAQPGDPILAIGDSVVKGVIPNWYSGQPLVWAQLLNEHGQPAPTPARPYAGRYWYISEQITNLPHIGQMIKAGDPFVTYASSGTATEIGWATSTGETLSAAHGTRDTHPNHSNTPEGVAFASLMADLGLK